MVYRGPDGQSAPCVGCCGCACRPRFGWGRPWDVPSCPREEATPVCRSHWLRCRSRPQVLRLLGLEAGGQAAGAKGDAGGGKAADGAAAAAAGTFAAASHISAAPPGKRSAVRAARRSSSICGVVEPWCPCRAPSGLGGSCASDTGCSAHHPTTTDSSFARPLLPRRQATKAMAAMAATSAGKPAAGSQAPAPLDASDFGPESWQQPLTLARLEAREHAAQRAAERALELPYSTDKGGVAGAASRERACHGCPRLSRVSQADTGVACHCRTRHGPSRIRPHPVRPIVLARCCRFPRQAWQ
jgi:hypothetical protein